MAFISLTRQRTLYIHVQKKKTRFPATLALNSGLVILSKVEIVAFEDQVFHSNDRQAVVIIGSSKNR